MPERWVLERAGILNVYQYGEETLAFAGGRLLLRGINGSGKSTAMNMLLPFLLEAETRRIDAAGEQSGVLRSWMLSGRHDEPQPTGYLWVEVRRGADEHLSFGCGIRASQSTERVSTWWFVTSRRIGIDLHLLEGRTPLSQEALRAAIGTEHVWPHAQRAGYRAELRRLLYGGADIDQHLRLLHVVRSPRVGDRIDLDLPTYLRDALPQLSEEALDDAAQPLEDLEEHRRNVEELGRTSTSLAALQDQYRAYARSELHRRAAELDGLVTAHRDAERDESGARAAHATARRRLDDATATEAGLEADERRLGHEILTLKSLDAYQAGADLNDLRTLVGELVRMEQEAQERCAAAARRLDDARRELATRRRDAEEGATALQAGLGDLARLTLEAGLVVAVPDTPLPVASPASSGDEPPAPPDIDAFRRELGLVLAAASDRRHDVAEVALSLDVIDEAEAALRLAERQAAASAATADAAERRAVEARAAQDEEVDRWRDRLTAWRDALAAHRHRSGVPTTVGVLPDLPEDLTVDTGTIVEGHRHAADAVVDHHLRLEAVLTSRLATCDEAASASWTPARCPTLRRFPGRGRDAPPAWPSWSTSDRR
jgi:energy-coupling factor transporter ATP-binding protein EcfA2